MFWLHTVEKGSHNIYNIHRRAFSFLPYGALYIRNLPAGLCSAKNRPVIFWETAWFEFQINWIFFEKWIFHWLFEWKQGRKTSWLKTYTLALPLKWHHTSSITRRIITAPKHRPRISSLFAGLSEKKLVITGLNRIKHKFVNESTNTHVSTIHQ